MGIKEDVKGILEKFGIGKKEVAAQAAKTATAKKETSPVAAVPALKKETVPGARPEGLAHGKRKAGV